MIEPVSNNAAQEAKIAAQILEIAQTKVQGNIALKLVESLPQPQKFEAAQSAPEPQASPAPQEPQEPSTVTKEQLQSPINIAI